MHHPVSSLAPPGDATCTTKSTYSHRAVRESPRALPDLALEVIWTSGLLDKMEVYRGLGIREVWLWRDGRIETNVLRDGAYERAAQSELLPGVDHEAIASLLEREDQTTAVREYRRSLQR